ncbi:MAG: LemA family protein [Rhodospirillaceae bacterium]|jgi:LemA protein|nr:LemA family protein [Rhodospirillaceae bacterium]
MEAFLVILCVLIALLYFWYAKIIGRKNSVKESLSGIDVQLLKRSELIPNILAIAKKFMEHEKDLIETVTKLRTQAAGNYNESDPNSVEQHLEVSAALGSEMGRLMISMESYPDLKSNETMLQAQQTYNEVEAQIAAARRFYNASVTQLNNSIEIFPGNLLAPLAKAKIMPFFEIEETARKPVNAAELLN